MLTHRSILCKLNAKKKVEPVRNQGESEVGSMEGWKRKPPPTLLPMGATHDRGIVSESANSLH